MATTYRTPWWDVQVDAPQGKDGEEHEFECYDSKAMKAAIKRKLPVYVRKVVEFVLSDG